MLPLSDSSDDEEIPLREQRGERKEQGGPSQSSTTPVEKEGKAKGKAVCKDPVAAPRALRSTKWSVGKVSISFDLSRHKRVTWRLKCPFPVAHRCCL